MPEHPTAPTPENGPLEDDPHIDGLPGIDLPVSASSLDPREVFDDAAGTSPVGSRIDDGARAPRFEGDTSELPDEVCWTLQELVAAPFVSEESKGHWPVLVQYEEVLRSRLSELGMLLVMDHERRHAFTRQADDPSPAARRILRSRTLGLAASTLALYLWTEYAAAPETAVVERADMIDHMMSYQRAGDTDDAAFVDRVDAAIRTLLDAAVIRRIKDTDRYVIHGVIASMLTADQVEDLTARYLAVAGGAERAADAEDAEVPPEDAETTDRSARVEEPAGE